MNRNGLRVALESRLTITPCGPPAPTIHANRTFLISLGPMIFGCAGVARQLAMTTASHAHTLVERKADGRRIVCVLILFGRARRPRELGMGHVSS